MDDSDFSIELWKELLYHDFHNNIIIEILIGICLLQYNELNLK
jgi:hypothetical protein